MKQVSQKKIDYVNHARDAAARDALLREITCLKRQMERLRHHRDIATSFSLDTYNEMIRSRERMLSTF